MGAIALFTHTVGFLREKGDKPRTHCVANSSESGTAAPAGAEITETKGFNILAARCRPNETLNLDNKQETLRVLQAIPPMEFKMAAWHSKTENRMNWIGWEQQVQRTKSYLDKANAQASSSQSSLPPPTFQASEQDGGTEYQFGQTTVDSRSTETVEFKKGGQQPSTFVPGGKITVEGALDMDTDSSDDPPPFHWVHTHHPKIKPLVKGGPMKKIDREGNRIRPFSNTPEAIQAREAVMTQTIPVGGPMAWRRHSDPESDDDKEVEEEDTYEFTLTEDI